MNSQQRMELIIELIETLWNVNKLTLHDNLPWHIELIETLWNVNRIGKNILFPRKMN